MIPPNVAPPKTVVVSYPGAEDKVRKQYVYQTYVSEGELSRNRIVPGNRLIVKFRDEIVGEGQAILVEPTTLRFQRHTNVRVRLSGGLVERGGYSATLGKLSAGELTAIGTARSFRVK